MYGTQFKTRTYTYEWCNSNVKKITGRWNGLTSLLVVSQPAIQDLYLHWEFSGGFGGKDSSGRAEKCRPFSHDMMRIKKSSFYYMQEYLKVTCQKGQTDGNLALPSQQLAYLNSISSLLYYVMCILDIYQSNLLFNICG
jgi:hypothetical protein